MNRRALVRTGMLLAAFLAMRCGTNTSSTEPISSGIISGTVTFVGAFDKGKPADPSDSTAVRDTTFYNIAAYVSTLWDDKQNHPLASPSRVILLDSAALANGKFSYSFNDLLEGDYYIFARATKIDPGSGRPRYDSTFVGLYRIGANVRDSLFADVTNPLHPPAPVHISKQTPTVSGVDFLAWASADSVHH